MNLAASASLLLGPRRHHDRIPTRGAVGTARVLTRFGLARHSTLDEEELRRGAGRDSCICPAERKTARRHGPPCRSPRYEQSGCPRSLSACKHPNSNAVRKRSEALPGSAPATDTLAVGDLAAALRLPKRNRHEPGNRASALPRLRSRRRRGAHDRFGRDGDLPPASIRRPRRRRRALSPRDCSAQEALARRLWWRRRIADVPQVALE